MDDAAPTIRGLVTGVSRSEGHTFSKRSVDEIELVAGLGVQDDAHLGARVKHRSRVAADPAQPNLRQVHLIHDELFDLVADGGFQVTAGDLGENITTNGIDLLALPVGAVLSIGDDALLAVTGLRNPCGQINGFQSGLLDAVRPRLADGSVDRLAGVMSVVIRGGLVRAGDPIEAALPPGQQRPLERV